MTDSIKVAVFNTVELANAFRQEAPEALRVPAEAPISIDGKYAVKVLGGPKVRQQRLAVIRDGVLVGLDP